MKSNLKEKLSELRASA